MKKNTLFVLIVTVSFLISCTSDNVSYVDPNNNPVDNIAENIPVVVNNENSFTFALRASRMDFLYDDALTFTSDSLVITITALKSSSTNSSFTIYDNLNQVIYSENLNTSKVIVKTDLGGKIPVRAKISLINYSGELTLVVANKNAINN